MTRSMLSRRRFLGTALAAGAAMAVPGTARAAAEAARGAAPQTLAASGRPTAGAQRTSFRIGYLGLTWAGDSDSDGGAVRFRRSGRWSEWQPLLPGDSPGDSPDDSTGGGRRSALVPAGGAIEYELTPPPGAADLRVLAINTTDGPPAATPLARRSSVLPTPIDSSRLGSGYLSRAAWGADESLRFGPDGEELFPPAFFNVQTLTVHHTVTANDDPDPAATVRAVYFFHTVTQDFGDIGYHLLVDRNGFVYEGRWSGPDRIPVFAGRSAGPLPQMSNGAHVGGFNAGNVGVALLGDLTTAQPTPAARQALVQVLAALARVTKLDPLGTTAYVNPISGATKTVKTIAGHRDWLATECPGEAFYPTLPTLRTEVAAALG